MLEIRIPTKVSHFDGRYSMWFQVDSSDEDSPLEIYWQLYAQMMGW